MGAVESLRNEVLDKILREENFTTHPTHMSLHTADPGATGTDEATGGSYARQAISFASAAGGESDSDVELTFSDLAAGTYTHVGLWSAVSGGTFLWRGALSSSKTLDAGDTLVFAIGDITVPTSGV